MGRGPGGFLSTSKGGKAVHKEEFLSKITAAVTQQAIPIDDSRALTGFAAAAFTQAIIDAHLGTTSEFTAAQFDATALGADAQGFIFDMGKQVDKLEYVEAECHTGTELLTTVSRRVVPAGLTDSTLDTEAELGADGNVAVRVDWGNSPDFDALTAGTVKITLYWRAK